MPVPTQNKYRSRAVAFDEFGGPEVLSILERTLPSPAPGEVLVGVAASTVNPTDLLMRAGQQAALMRELAPPYIAGMEFAGHVRAIGAAVTALSVGQPVMGLVNPRRPQGGSHADLIAVPAASVVALPDTQDLVAAATLPMNGMTALMAIEALELSPGDSLLVTGAAGAVGGYVIALAKRSGLFVIADAKDDDVALVRSFGADAVLPRGAALEAALRQIRPQGVDALVDTALIGERVAPLVRSGGIAVSLRRSNPIQDARLKARYVSVVERMTDTAALARLRDALRDGVLTPRVAARLPMEQAAVAHRRVEQGGLRGRVVLTFETS